MEYRKLISFGKGGFVISVPKGWVESNRLRKGSVVILKKEGDSLVLTPSQENPLISHDESSNIISINVDNLPYTTTMQMLTSAYLNSVNTIHIVGKSLPSMISDLREDLQQFIALEIVESNPTKIVLRDLLDFNALSLPERMRKIDIIIRSILSDIKEKKIDLTSIKHNCRRVGRLFLLIRKAVRKSAYDPSSKKSMQLSLYQLMTLAHYGRSMNVIVKELKKFAELFTEKLDEETHGFIFESVGEVQELYLYTMRALHKEDTSLAYSLLDREQEIIEKLKGFQKANISAYPVPLLCERLIGVVEQITLIQKRVTEGGIIK